MILGALRRVFARTATEFTSSALTALPRRLTGLLPYSSRAMDDEDSPRRNELMGLANVLRDLKGAARERMLEALSIAFNEFEVSFIVEQADR